MTSKKRIQVILGAAVFGIANYCAGYLVHQSGDLIAIAVELVGWVIFMEGLPPVEKKS